ncbi:SRPBCC family protein [Streptomyces sp. VRA16 Mangrove soil]|uniref:SRPBCC family protein n=1 Tax=Streptomyces sp. VRA16 Mangrove soil TaxID=2817434 RepID=UPI001A9CF88D|nr:SRPBCC family protein [Streptomyces sp. VRA16 Mangrove soil]MBO1332230.1 SRPBCC family protein [Streptomyces sp. VRA16 Mangrove soil]
MEWTGARYADTPTVEVRRRIGAPARRVWELVTDVSLMPRLSDELQAAAWVGEPGGPEVGARFVGRNRHEAFGEWETTSYVVECVPLKTFAWAVADPELPSATWRFTLDEQPDGSTELTQWARLGPGRSGLSHAIDRMPEKEQKIVHVRLGEFERNMGATLDALKALAEGEL